MQKCNDAQRLFYPAEPLVESVRPFFKTIHTLSRPSSAQKTRFLIHVEAMPVVLRNT